MGFLGGAQCEESTCQYGRHEMWVRSLGWEDPLEQEMVPLSSILAWKIPWAEEPDGLQAMGSHGIEHN